MAGFCVIAIESFNSNIKDFNNQILNKSVNQRVKVFSLVSWLVLSGHAQPMASCKQELSVCQVPADSLSPARDTVVLSLF